MCLRQIFQTQPFLVGVDALNIDWSGLVQQQPIRTAPQSSSALKRFQPASVFARIGVSKAFAGAALVEKVRQQIEAGKEAEAIVKEETGTIDLLLFYLLV